MFTSVGPRAFEGKVLVVRLDASDLTTVLDPQQLREYVAADGNSLKNFILVSVDQSSGSNSDLVNITAYTPHSGKFEALQAQLPPGEEGSGVLSPDDSKFVAEIGPPGPQLNLWVSDFSTGQFRQLTQGSAQDFLPVWSPDGQQIVFIRLLPPFPSITSQLMSVPYQGGEPSILLGTSEHVGEAAYSPDGRFLVFTSINWLETIELRTMQRKVLFTKDELHGNPRQRLTKSRGLSWATTQQKIVLIILDLATNRDELWTAATDGSKLQKIFTGNVGARFFSVTFINN